MKQIAWVCAMGILSACATAAGAQEVGRVISSTPMIQQVAVPRQVCNQQPMVVQQPNSGAGAIMGGIAGGAMGNAIGGGSGRAAATMIGLVGGALLGNNIEGSGQQVQNVQQCSTQTFYESRTSGYQVVYEYAGREYTVQMPYDPGATLPVQVTPMGANMAPPVPRATAPGNYPGQPNLSGTPIGVIVGPPMGQPMVAPQAVYAEPYPYYTRPWYPPIGISLGLGYTYHRHRH
ncbi:MAG TPA: hypothetical protein VLI46_15975 [Ramlibacter sp.]|nr:hypothetical protein [Ramlibacter sp.]